MEGENIMTINNILNSRTLQELLDATEEFCKKAIIRDNDDICIELREKLASSEDNEYLIILASYMSAAEDGDEIIEALYEFAANCKGFVEIDEEITQQVTKEEFETILAECEDKCALKTCIEDSHVLNVAEIPMYNQYREFGLRFKNDAINLFLPKIEINKNTKEYIAEELGLILYKVLTTKFDEDFIQHELYRYIPDARREELRTKQLFVKYFYQVILYQERKPGIYTKFDDHMRRVIILEFYKRIITAYLDKNK